MIFDFVLIVNVLMLLFEIFVFKYLFGILFVECILCIMIMDVLFIRKFFLKKGEFFEINFLN